MTMHMMPVYYTTNNTKTKKKPIKNKRILAALAEREDYLRKQGCHPDQLKKKPKKFVEWKGHDVYRRETKYIPSLNSTGGVDSCSKKDNTEQLKVSSNYTIAPAYNKGAYQVITKESIKDIGR
jgi:hypothetical protein